MTPEQIEKANWLSGIYTSVACGETLQVWKKDVNQWDDVSWEPGPCLTSDLAHWRIKPKPQKAWVVWKENPIGIFLDKENASATATLYGGTIQEITRPES